MKISILTFAFLCLLNCSAWAQAPKHYVFLVHGIGATPTTFGVMKEALQKESKVLDSHTDWQFVDFAYDVGDDTKNIMAFSKELGDFISNTFIVGGGLRPDDKFSLVMHSQGGLIGLNLMLKSFLDDGRFHPELKNHLDAFITMATPYWGAKIAIFAGRMIPILKYLKVPLSDMFGLEELKDMEIISDFNTDMRETLINPVNQIAMAKIKKQARMLVFSGMTEGLKLLAPFVTGKDRFEDDTAVPIPSSRPDFLYYTDTPEKHEDDVWAEDFKETSIIGRDNYIVVNAFHISPFPQRPKSSGIGAVPDRCLNLSYNDCDHPTYPTIVEHLFKLQRRVTVVRDLSSFAIDLKVNLLNQNIDRKKLAVAFKALTPGLGIGKDLELYNNVTRWTSKGDFRLYQTGYIDSKVASADYGEIEVLVTAPGFQKRRITVPVKTTLSSYINVNLVRE